MECKQLTRGSGVTQPYLRLHLQRFGPGRGALLEHDGVEVVGIAEAAHGAGGELDGRRVIMHGAHQHHVHAPSEERRHGDVGVLVRAQTRGRRAVQGARVLYVRWG